MNVDLAALASVTPECRGLREHGDDLWLGLIAIPRAERYATWTPRAPTYRRGWTYALPQDATFVIEPFQRADGRAFAVVLTEPGGRHVAGWFGAEREQEARAAAERLNREVRAVWAHWHATQQAAGAAELGASKNTVRFEEGHEYAPDARWGLQVLTVDDAGAYTYEQRRGGRQLASAAGRFDAVRIGAVVEALARSTFPVVPARPFPPGATVLMISLGEGQRVNIERWHASELPGYREAVDGLLALTDEARKALPQGSR